MSYASLESTKKFFQIFTTNSLEIDRQIYVKVSLDILKHR